MPRLLSSFATMAAVRAVVWAAGLLPAALPTAARAADTVDYRQDVKPILQEKCYSCHGALKQEAGLRLETRALMVDKGGVVVPGEPAESYLLERIVAEGGERMPPPDEGAALLPDEIEILRRWIETGAAAPDEAVPVDPGDHWAFRPIVRPAVPEIPVPERAEGPSPAAPLKDAAPAAGSNPIDAFLATHRRQQGLQAQPLAARPLQIRRLYLDLIGLPPTVEQLQDDRPWEQIIEELLHSPHHGERWARHWMDVWRYSDWYGLGKQLRYSQKHLWHWRDWIIESLNADKGYDRMIQEMLAGDELAPHDPDIVRATGFLARNYYLFNRTTWLDSTIEHTGKAFLGLTINCAKCHDHKYDPISQLDYYRFRAIFEPHQVRLDPVPGETDLEQDGLPRVFDNHLDAETYLHLRGDPKNPDKETAITPGVPAILASFAPPVEPVELPVPAYAPALREHVQQDQLAAAQRRIDSAEQALAQARDDWAAQQAASQVRPPATAAPADPPFVVEDDFDEPRPALWELVGNGWEYQDGALHQRHATREDERIILRPTPPRDFELACRYTTTGGTTYKSVTFRFDHASDDQYANFVYTSAHRPGPKVQVAYTREGQSIYPPAGRAPRPITVGKTYTLRFAVRDTLLNVWLDDELVLAHQLPNRGGERRISLAGFDATVAFDSVAIRKLADDQTLQPATGGQAMPPAGEQAVRRAAAELAVAEADYASLRDRLAADQAKFTQRLEPAAWEPLGRQAARSETLAAQRAAERDRLLAGEDAKKQKAAEAALAKAETRLQAIAAGEPVEYRSVKVTRKALETPADTEADYPATFPSASTGRRLALARWLTSAENP